ncbi:MAG TPA: META domain-containing protein, partial [Trueperaceae bacterium]|nr:META domain-containing protein [Trueperaceae bacterium]
MTGRVWRVRTAAVRTAASRYAVAALLALALALALTVTVTATAQQSEDGAATSAADVATSGSAARAVFGASTWVIDSVVANGERIPISADLPNELVLLPDLPALAGSAGCNRMTARLDLDSLVLNRFDRDRFGTDSAEGRIEFSPITATLMACPEPAMTQERGVFEALEDVTHFRLEPGRVVLNGPGAEVVLVNRPRGGGGTAPSKPAELEAFNQAVAVAADAGASWPRDPLRVALAFVELSQALQTTVTAAVGDVGAVVTVVESGFRDDSVGGVTRRVS